MLKTVRRQMHVIYQTTPDQNPPEDPGLVTFTVDTETAWPDSMRVALAYLASTTSRFESLEKFRLFKHDIERYPDFDMVSFISLWDRYLDKDGDDWNIMRFITASPKPVVDRPPFSECPRCELWIWPEAIKRVQANHLPEDTGIWLERARQAYQDYPEPHYCLHCGQRFKYSDGLNYRAWSSVKDIVSELGIIAKSQPTFEDITD